ncbi:hypothetical protein CWATWH0402_5670 [Crocosphaera watsonii WH 0402]|uniref:Uncharacterized protein n=2 Tax=Crocosphaera watsonii TaxID=263511 RepID=T2JYT8_CROWT|nr:hypothetical protein CWATWH0003_B163 [Crocosphaera watsonii WH 0003]CCQ70400.1 hypothetical protein CWATWH0402_5670 [Crocosphaera watsonii WH 0402]
MKANTEGESNRNELKKAREDLNMIDLIKKYICTVFVLN